MSASNVSSRLRRGYLWLWHEKDDGSSWPIIFANLKFATFNICLAIVILAGKLVWSVIAMLGVWM